MSEANAAVADGSEWSLFEIDTAAKRKVFYGKKFAPVNTRWYETSLRWTEFTAYKTMDGRYVLVVTGHSRVYHRYNSPCNSGIAATAAEMDRIEEKIGNALVSCRTCKPEDYLTGSDDDMYHVEISLPRVYICRNSKSLIRKLQDREGNISYPAERLLVNIREADPDMARELAEAEPL